QYTILSKVLTGLTVNYSATIGTQGIDATPVSGGTDYGNLTTSGGGTKILQGDVTVFGNVTIGGGSVLDVSSNSFTMNVGGNWTKNGTFDPHAGMVIFDQATPGNIGTSNFNNITFSGQGTKTATGALSIAGNVLISDNFTAGNGLTHTVSGNWTRNGNFTATGSTIDFDGTTPGNIGTSNFNNITFSGQ